MLTQNFVEKFTKLNEDKQRGLITAWEYSDELEKLLAPEIPQKNPCDQISQLLAESFYRPGISDDKKILLGSLVGRFISAVHSDKTLDAADLWGKMYDILQKL